MNRLFSVKPLAAGPEKLKIYLLPIERDQFSASKTGKGLVAIFQVGDDGKSKSLEISGGRLFDLFGNRVLFQRTIEQQQDVEDKSVMIW